MKRYVVVLAVMALLVVALAVPAFAAGQGKPEDVPRGQVERGPEHARSICSFSGLNDNPGVEGGQTQSYGQLVRHDEIEPSAKGEGPTTPGFFCNPVKGPFALK
jgi:hypothetical protein